MYEKEIGNNYIAATLELGMNLTEDGQKYIHSMHEFNVCSYIQAGFIVMNNKAILKDNVHVQFKEWSNKKLKFQDQDILNVVCRGRIYNLSLE